MYSRTAVFSSLARYYIAVEFAYFYIVDIVNLAWFCLQL